MLCCLASLWHILTAKSIWILVPVLSRLLMTIRASNMCISSLESCIGFLKRIVGHTPASLMAVCRDEMFTTPRAVMICFDRTFDQNRSLTWTSNMFSSLCVCGPRNWLSFVQNSDDCCWSQMHWWFSEILEFLTSFKLFTRYFHWKCFRRKSYTKLQNKKISLK